MSWARPALRMHPRGAGAGAGSCSPEPGRGEAVARVQQARWSIPQGRGAEAGEGALAGHPPGQLAAAAGAGRVLLLSPYEQLLTFPFCLLFHPMRAFPQQVLQTPVFSQTFLLETRTDTSLVHMLLTGSPCFWKGRHSRLHGCSEGGRGPVATRRGRRRPGRGCQLLLPMVLLAQRERWPRRSQLLSWASLPAAGASLGGGDPKEKKSRKPKLHLAPRVLTDTALGA